MPPANVSSKPATSSATENLALLYQGVLTAIVRLQTGRMRLDDPQSFCKLMENLFKEVGKEASKAYTAEDIADANCIMAAFLDETAERLLGAGRERWTFLYASMFPRTVAGNAVFDRLNSIRARTESVRLAELLEVYYLCLLLGYEGRYAGRPTELEECKEQLRRQIEGLRGSKIALSPHGDLPRRNAPAAAPTLALPSAPRTSARWKTISALCLVLAGAGWVALRFLLNSESQGIVRGLVLP